MFTPEFDYHKAGSVAEALELLSSNAEARLLAGGHSLLPLMRLRLARPSVLIDIGGLADLKGITVQGDAVRLGALTTHGEIAASPELARANPLLAEVAGGIGDPQVRNRGDDWRQHCPCRPGLRLGNGFDRPGSQRRGAGA